MINIYPLQNSYDNGFIVSGHAEYAPHGSDIVCASVSALTQTIAMGLKTYASIKEKVKPGYLQVEITEPSNESHALMYTLMKGLRSIAQQHGDNITIWESDY